MSSYDIEATRRAMLVRWDAAREERVLGRALETGERRAHRRRAVTWATVSLACGLLFRWATKPVDASQYDSLATPSGPPSSPSQPGRASPVDGGEPQRDLGGVAGAGEYKPRSKKISGGSGGNAGTT
jgi:hypothetical protein